MRQMMNYPVLIAVITLISLWAFALLGAFLRSKKKTDDESENGEFGMVLSATLTLLGLIIGFIFSMAIGRYDQRKNYEEEEANAIGTEYVRADFLPASQAANVRTLLLDYLGRRIDNYKSRDRQLLRRIQAETTRLQNRMWSAVSAGVVAQPTPIMALVVSGMNDVLNSQGYTQAAWRNRVPIEAWALLSIISVFCNVMIAYGARGRAPLVLVILPVVLSISLF